MVLTLTPPCRNCGGRGEYREPDPAGRGYFVRCEMCNPEPEPIVTQLATLLDRIGWSVPHLAGRLGLTQQAVYRWHCGRNTRGNPCSAPADVIAWLERVAAAIEAEPPPAKSPPS